MNKIVISITILRGYSACSHPGFPHLALSRAALHNLKSPPREQQVQIQHAKHRLRVATYIVPLQIAGNKSQ